LEGRNTALPEPVNKLFECHFTVGEKRVWFVAAAVKLAETKAQEHHAEEVSEQCGGRGWKRLERIQ
jgi:hypothetical protein